METRAHYVVIGSVVMIVVAAAFLFILWKSQSGRDVDEYDIIFTERVSGLSEGATVSFNGIKKGVVDKLSLDLDNPEVVIARVHVDDDTPVKTDTKAELELVGFTGGAIIQFVGGTPGAPLLKEVSEDRVPKIPADTSGLAAVLESSGDVLARANRLLSDENIDNFAGIIKNVEILTGAVADNEKDIVALLENAKLASANLADMTAKLNAAGTVEEVDAVLNESRALVADLRKVIDENRASIRVFADQGLGQVAPALAEARRLMQTLDYMLREIDRDPQAYFLGEIAPEYGVAEE